MLTALIALAAATAAATAAPQGASQDDDLPDLRDCRSPNTPNLARSVGSQEAADNLVSRMTDYMNESAGYLACVTNAFGDLTALSQTQYDAFARLVDNETAQQRSVADPYNATVGEWFETKYARSTTAP